MKKIVFAILLFFSVSFLWAQNYQVVDNSWEQVRLVFTAGEMSVMDVTTEAGDFSRITMEGAQLSSEVGQPQLPVTVCLLEIPLCDGVNYEIRSSHYVDYTAEELGIRNLVFPAQPSYSKSDDGEKPLVRDVETYQSNQWYHRNLIEVEKTGILRCINMATVYFSPVQYNPVTRMFRIYDEVEVAFTYENADIPATCEMKSLHNNVFVNGMQQRVINPISDQNREPSFSQPIRYLIVAHSMFRGELDGFVAWKKRQGFEVEVAYTDDAAVGSTTTSIAEFIKSKYTQATADQPAPSFLLLVGDVQQIPAFTGVSETDHVTDLYYATWTNGDNIPDCFYGRFPAQTVAQLHNIVDKVLQYEQYTMPDPTYLDDAVLVAGTDSYFGPTHANGQINYLSQQYINTGYGYSNVYVHLYNCSSQAATIRSEIGAGVGYANYTAHCGADGWGDPQFSVGHISAMNNENKYGLMIGNCCLSNKFDEDECFGEAIVRTAHKGAVGYIGASNSTYWGEDYYWSVGYRATVNDNPNYDASWLGAYDRLFHTHGEGFSDWYVTGGSIITGGNLAVEATTSGSKLYYWEIYHLMGDPSMLPWLTQAETMSVTVDDAVVSGTTSLSVRTNVPYAYVALTQDGAPIAAATADNSGSALLSFPAMEAIGLYELAISGQNFQPFFQTINVVAPSGPYVVPSNPQIHDGVAPNYNAYLQCDITLRSLGVEEASDITVALTSPSSYVSFVDNTFSVSQMAPGETRDFPAAFSFNLNDQFTDGTVIPFVVTVIYNGEYSNDFYFNIVANAPVLYSAAFTVTETEGNQDGHLQGGETCQLSIPVVNDGHAPAVDIYSYLTCAYASVTLVNSNVSLGTIAPQGRAVANYTIRLDESIPTPFIIPMLHHVYAAGYSYVDTIYLTLGDLVEDFETGDFSKFHWNNVNNHWTLAQMNTFEGSYSARSSYSDLAYGEKAQLKLTVEASIDDTISYYRRISLAEGYDYFAFSIDGEVMENIAAPHYPWTRSAFPVSAGTHEISFEYYRGRSYGSNYYVMLDYIKLPMCGEMAPLAIQEHPSETLSLYPNPVSDEVTVALPASSCRTFHLALFDLAGRQLISKEIPAGENEYCLDVSALPTGVYLISLFNEEMVLGGKVVKK
ncbi:MAG: T9SS type A sorting domain-containing protein [Bacteroidales bacterium]|nr:T9SS type A sorting domain-containing protein [Bacteroidales bacterium]